jgi:serine/threonine protein kinase
VAILRIAIGISSAAAHLHEQGIMHGDLYAHNILLNSQDHPLLGDFGAASSYDLDDQITSVALERLEVRAFGYLLEDLLNHCELSDDAVESLIFDLLDKLKQDCLAPIPTDRPVFGEISKTLALIMSFR